MEKSEKNSKQDSLEDKHTTVQTGLPPGWTRYTILVRIEHLENLRTFSYWYRKPIKFIVDKMLENFFSTRKIPQRPTFEEDLMNELFKESKKE